MKKLRVASNLPEVTQLSGSQYLTPARVLMKVVMQLHRVNTDRQQKSDTDETDYRRTEDGPSFHLCPQPIVGLFSQPVLCSATCEAVSKGSQSCIGRYDGFRP